jgi:hypothetical protein
MSPEGTSVIAVIGLILIFVLILAVHNFDTAGFVIVIYLVVKYGRELSRTKE